MKEVILFLTLSLLLCNLDGAVFYESAHAPWGRDHDLPTSKNKPVESAKSKLSPPQKSCRAMIRFFQVYISPIDGPRSSFYPTSSQYALEAIQKYGVLKGIAMGCDRLMRENGEMWIYSTTKNYGIERKLDPVR